jgi:hypothetical protein
MNPCKKRHVVPDKTSKANIKELNNDYTGLTEDLKTLLHASIHSLSISYLCY